jgi:hypothetical protein
LTNGRNANAGVTFTRHFGSYLGFLSIKKKVYHLQFERTRFIPFPPSLSTNAGLTVRHPVTSTGINKNVDAKTSPVPELGDPSSTGMLQIRTEMPDVGITILTASASMSVLGYDNVLYMYLRTRKYVNKVAKISIWAADQ